MTNNLLTKLLVLSWFCLAQMIGPINAQAQSFDVEPPVIEHDIIESSPASERQTFTATVADDAELSNVRFFYRFAGEARYTSLDMNKVSTSSTFSVDIPTQPDDPRLIEYYIEARDVSGNRTLRGYSFSPLSRAIEVPQIVTTAATDSGPTRSYRRPIYIALGVLALGALVVGLASAGGDSDDSGTGTGSSNCDNGQCDFILTINPPGL